MQIVDPLHYFSECQLRESRVLGVTYNGSTRQVRLDIDYAAEAVSHWFEARLSGTRIEDYEGLPADFRRFTFCGVSSVSRNPGASFSHEDPAQGWAEIVEVKKPRLPVVELFMLTRTQDTFTSRLLLNERQSYSIEFTFLGMDVRVRQGRFVRNIANESLYEDVEEKTTFHFFNPFADDH